MKGRLILPAILALMPAACAWGTDVYFYQQASSTPVKTVTDVHKLVFSDGLTSAIDKNGVETKMNHVDFDYISFHGADPSSVESLKSVSELTISFVGGNVEVVSAESIDRVSICDISGRTIAAYSPASNSFTIPSGDLPSGVLIVRAVSGNQTSVSKIIK